MVIVTHHKDNTNNGEVIKLSSKHPKDPGRLRYNDPFTTLVASFCIQWVGATRRSSGDGKYLDMSHLSGSVSKPCTPVVHIKIAGKWMFIPLKMVLIGIDPTPYLDMSHLSLSKRQRVIEKTKAVVKEGIFHGEYSINDMRRFYDFKSRSSCHLCTGLSVGKGSQFKSSMSIPKDNN